MSLIVFDFDGTLADTIPAISAAVNAALTSLGYPTRDGEHIRRSVGDGARTLCRRVLPDELYDDEAALDRYEGFPTFYYKKDIRLQYKGIRSGRRRTVSA
jgi:phosphoglycolate phosphatase-like HAD superfamily hydrolase